MEFFFPQEALRDEMSVESDLQEAFLQAQQAGFVGRRKLLSGALQTLKDARDVVLVHGKPGTGKSAFMVRALWSEFPMRQGRQLMQEPVELLLAFGS